MGIAVFLQIERRSCERVQKTLDITFYWTFTFSSLFFENNIPCLDLSFFPTFVLDRVLCETLNLGNTEWNLFKLKYPC